MEARHCLAAASVIFSQAGQVPSAEDSKFIQKFWIKYCELSIIDR